MKKIFFAMSVTAFMMVMPGIAQADDLETANAAQEAVIEEVTEPDLSLVCTMYSRGEYEIKAEPTEDSETLGVSLLNTSFDVVGHIGDWSIIQTAVEDAYIKTVHLSEIPITYTEEDLDVLAHVICGEAQSSPDDEQLYVGSVVLNRRADPRFPNSIKGVVFQKGQYACVGDGNYYREPTERNWANARMLLENGSVLPPNVIWQSGGKQGKGVYLRTKWHYYCY